MQLLIIRQHCSCPCSLGTGKGAGSGRGGGGGAGRDPNTDVAFLGQGPYDSGASGSAARSGFTHLATPASVQEEEDQQEEEDHLHSKWAAADAMQHCN